MSLRATGPGRRRSRVATPGRATAALACLAETERLGVVTNAAARRTQIFEGALALLTRQDVIGDARGGHGPMTAIEMVSDRGNRTPPAKEVAVVVQEAAYRNGAMIFILGPNVILSPAPMISPEDVVVIPGAIDAAFAALREPVKSDPVWFPGFGAAPR